MLISWHRKVKHVESVWKLVRSFLTKLAFSGGFHLTLEKISNYWLVSLLFLRPRQSRVEIIFHVCEGLILYVLLVYDSIKILMKRIYYVVQQLWRVLLIITSKLLIDPSQDIFEVFWSNRLLLWSKHFFDQFWKRLSDTSFWSHEIRMINLLKMQIKKEIVWEFVSIKQTLKTSIQITRVSHVLKAWGSFKLINRLMNKGKISWIKSVFTFLAWFREDSRINLN